ncbi:MAG: helix-hairpin-helix domain-containing protein [Epsilonproteobacteria bacterium]|nr:helix-hairpin-helix domain-containing protein [Campylobacterota bacterium]
MRVLLVLVLCLGFLFASVDINKADQEELATLSGIGATKAVEIVTFRKANGCFKSIDDLVKVKGIGKKTLEKNRKELTISQCK